MQDLAGAVGAWATLGRKNKVALRVDEMNAVTCGGLANFSNTMGPSLWALNVLPLYAQTGVTGVNFETQTEHRPEPDPAHGDHVRLAGGGAA